MNLQLCHDAVGFMRSYWNSAVSVLGCSVQRRIRPRGVVFTLLIALVAVTAAVSANNLLFLILAALLATLLDPLLGHGISRLSFGGLNFGKTLSTVVRLWLAASFFFDSKKPCETTYRPDRRAECCLASLVGLTLDGHATALLCRRTYVSTLLIQNLGRWSATPPQLIAHLRRRRPRRLRRSHRQSVCRRRCERVCSRPGP